MDAQRIHYNAVGKALGRVEGPAEVSGQATYAADILLPDMISGRAGVTAAAL